MNSAARCFLYSDVQPEITFEQYEDDPIQLNANNVITNQGNDTEAQVLITEENWIKHGEIIFDNNSEIIIKGLTCKILPEENVAIVGRTGCGKSALIQTLFRLGIIEKKDKESGGCIKIDGIDIQQVSTKLLRKSINILPQKPFIFSQNFRENIDPCNSYTDEQIWGVLKDLKLNSIILKLQDKLNTNHSEVMKHLSYGQQYLISLARIFLNQKQIIVIDEATTNLDMQTDEIMQKFIRQKFQHNTVITIAHRLISIADYDKVIVMHEGKIIEFGRPFKLLTMNDSDIMISRNSTFAQMVKSSGEPTALAIFKIAKDKHLNKQIAFKDIPIKN